MCRQFGLPMEAMSRSAPRGQGNSRDLPEIGPSGAGTKERLLEADRPRGLPQSWSRGWPIHCVQPPGARHMAAAAWGDREGQSLADLALHRITCADFTRRKMARIPDPMKPGRLKCTCGRFRPADGKWQISTNGGFWPRWGPDGRELFFMDAGSGGKLMAVDVTASGSTFVAGAPQGALRFRIRQPGPQRRVSHVRRRARRPALLIPRPLASVSPEPGKSPIVVVFNWAAGLKNH